jgi:hypothetical protein
VIYIYIYDVSRLRVKMMTKANGIPVCRGLGTGHHSNCNNSAIKSVQAVLGYVLLTCMVLTIADLKYSLVTSNNSTF